MRKRKRSPNVLSWIAEQRSTNLYISVVTIGEIERGIAQQQRKNPNFAELLVDWLDKVLILYDERILPIDLPTCRRGGQLSADIGHDSVDLMIAATALEHGLTVVTRNVRHFRPTGVSVFNPFLAE